MKKTIQTIIAAVLFGALGIALMIFMIGGNV